MAIITISRGSYSRGKEIAEKLAQQMGYNCIAREAIIEASEQFNIPEIKLVRAIHDAPSILHSFGVEEAKYITYIQTQLLRHAKKDNLVYHGLAGHFLFKNISHVFKVRILANMDERVELEMKREHITRKDALKILKNDDQQRRIWSKRLYGVDIWDLSLYDMVLHINVITPDDAVEIIRHAVGKVRFQTTAESQKLIDDLWLASEVKAVLVNIRPNIRVSANNGVVLVKTKAHPSQEEFLAKELSKSGQCVPGIKEIRVDVIPL